MPTPTYIPLATVTLGSSASSVTFSSIPATYRDLILVMNSKVVSSTASVRARFNGDSGSNYPRVAMSGDGSRTLSVADTQSFASISGATSVSDAFSYNSVTQIMDYSATDKHKTVLSRANNTSNEVSAIASRWANTSAITSVEVFVSSGSYDTGSTFALYGIAS
jgi:hypothetical protein